MARLTNPFRKNEPAPQPQLLSAETRYRQTSVYIKVDHSKNPPGDYFVKVAQHLEELDAKMRDFFPALTAAGKRQIITFQFPGANSCGGGINGMVKLRQEHSSRVFGGNRGPEFAAELQKSMTNAGKTVKQLAQNLMGTILYNWQGGVTANPFSATLGVGNQAVTATEQKINDWLAATAHPTDAEMDVLVLVLEKHLDRGNGAECRIYYDPNYVLGNRPPPVGLFHELVHAYYFAKGKQLGLCDSSSDANGGRHFELMAVGMAPFADRRFSENKMRELYGCPPRTQYP